MSMRVVAIIQSRMSSRRLPGKNLRPIAGRPMLGRLVDRLKRARTLDAICLATSVDPSDDPLREFADAEGILCHRGSLEDVLDRVLGAARAVDAELLVEVTGDCPLIDPGIIDAAVERFLRGGVDYLINVLDRLSFPIGFDVQIYRRELLEEVARSTQDPYDRVNVTPYIYRHGEKYQVVNLLAPPALDRPRYRLCVDYAEDFEVISQIYAHLLPPREDFTAFDIVRFLDAHPAVAGLNVEREDAFTFPTSEGGIQHEVLEIEEQRPAQ